MIFYRFFPYILEEIKKEERKHGNRHWLDFHFYNVTNVSLSISKALEDIDDKKKGTGNILAKNLMDIKYKESESDDRKRKTFEQLVQLIAEIMALQCICKINWPEGTKFDYEPQAPNGKRPEFRVETDQDIYLFEVKAPSLLKHKENRRKNAIQMPYRHSEGTLELFSEGFDGVTLPKDNTIKDFLLSAQDKFSSFSNAKKIYRILVIVWDSYMYEAISPLINPHNGLLTKNSWLGNDKFNCIDSVIVINKMDQIIEALKSNHVTGIPGDIEIKDTHLPNVAFNNVNGNAIPDFLIDAFHAFDGTHLKPHEFIGAEYAPLDMIMWIQSRQIPPERSLGNSSSDSETALQGPYATPENAIFSELSHICKEVISSHIGSLNLFQKSSEDPKYIGDYKYNLLITTAIDSNVHFL